MKPLTDAAPKPLLKLRGKPLLEYQLETFKACGIGDIVLVTGYRRQDLAGYGLKTCVNERYESTNMVHSLFCAERELSGDVIVSYGDIVFEKRVLDALLADKSGFGVVVDQGWLALWQARMNDPLKDAETMKLDAQGNITELGKKPASLDEIQGQYTGLFRISRDAIATVRDFHRSLDRSATYDGKDFDNMYMTSFIQVVIDHVMKVRAVPIRHGWLEVDTPEDLRRYESFGTKEAVLFRFGA